MKRVAMLVHNEVFKDARVRKEARTLIDAGYDVDIFGITRDWLDHPLSVEGARVELLHNTNQAKVKSFLRLSKGAFESVTVLLLLLLLGIAITYFDLAAQLRGALLALTLAYSVSLSLPRNSSARRTFASIIKITIVVVAAACTLELVRRGIFAPWDVALILFPLWVVARLNISPASIRRAAADLYNHKVKARGREVHYNRIAGLLKTRVLKGDYDIVHCHDIIALVAGGNIKKKRPKIKLIWDAHEIYEEVANSTALDRKLMQKIIKANERHVDQFITISESFKEFYSKNYKLPPAHVVMNATRFTGAPEDDGRLHRAAGLVRDQRILLYQGGFSLHRGLEKLMEAAANLPTGWSVVAMGWGRFKDDLEALAAELRVGAPAGRAPLVVVPPAPHEELARWSAGGTLGIIPYEDVCLNHTFCTPNKLWEFPNAGVPIIANDLVEVGKIIRTWGTGFLLPRNFTSSDIVQALLAVTGDEISASKRKCLAFSEQMSWTSFEPELLAAYGSDGSND